MKNWQKIGCVLALVGAMAMTVAAEDVVATTTPVTLPDLVHAEKIQITSSMASDDSDLTPLYDLSTETTVTFTMTSAVADATDEATTEGVDISMTTKEAFRLHSIVVNETETKYDAALYASTDGENWVEVKFDTKTRDGFVVYQAKNLGRDYKFYRLHATTKNGEALTFHTLAMYEKIENVWPFSLYQMFCR